MTKEALAKAQELNRHIQCRKEDLKNIKYYEDHYSDYPFQLKLLRQKDNIYSYTDIHDEKLNNIYSYTDIYDENLKKEILNLIKIRFISDIQKSEMEIEKL